MTVRAERSDSASVADPYASAGYGLATAAASGGEWLAIVADGWRLPLVLTGPPEGREAASPYGYAGLSVAPGIDGARASDLWAETRAFLKELGVVSLFLRFPPFAPHQAARASELEGLEVRVASTTILVPTPDTDAIWAALVGRARTSIRKAEREGLQASVQSYTAAAPSDRSAFRRLYDATMERLEAPAHLRFDDSYYETLEASLGDRLLLATVRDSESVVASCLLMDDGRTLHYHLSGSDPAGARLGANNLMIWAALREASERDLAAVHLGGGTRPGDSLFRFKSSFGGSAVPFHVGRAVIDGPRYADLVSRRAGELGISVASLLESDFFPAFRAMPAAEDQA